MIMILSPVDFRQYSPMRFLYHFY